MPSPTPTFQVINAIFENSHINSMATDWANDLIFYCLHGSDVLYSLTIPSLTRATSRRLTVQPYKIVHNATLNQVIYRPTNSGCYFLGIAGGSGKITDDFCSRLATYGYFVFCAVDKLLKFYFYSTTDAKYSLSNTVDLGDEAEDMIVDRINNLIFVACLNSFKCVDIANPSILYSTPKFTDTTSMALSVDLELVFVTSARNGNKFIWALNAIDGSQKYKITLDHNNPWIRGLGFDSTTQTLLVSYSSDKTNHPYTGILGTYAGSDGSHISTTPLLYGDNVLDGLSLHPRPDGDYAYMIAPKKKAIVEFESTIPPSPVLPSKVHIESNAFPGSYLRMNGQSSHVNCQAGAHSWEQYKFVPTTPSGHSTPYYAIESIAFPGYYLKMTSAPSEFKSNGGGAVSCVEETGTLPLECLFDIVPDGDTYLIKSAKFVNAYLRFDGHGGDGFSSNGFGTVNAQFGHQTWEQYNFLAAED